MINNNIAGPDGTANDYNFIQVVLRMLEVFLRKGYQTVKCSDLLNSRKYMEEIENALKIYIRSRNSSDKSDKSIIGYIFQLYIPMIVIAFNYAFKDPFLYKDSEEEVSSLRGAFLSEAYPIFTKLLEYVVGDAKPETADLTVIRERLTSLMFKRLTTVAYRKVVETELTEYHCNISPSEQNILDIEEQFEEVYGRPGTDEELAAFAGCRVSTIRRNKDSLNTKMTVSLEMEVGDSDNKHKFSDYIPCEYRDYQPEKVVDDMLNSEIDDELRKILKEREYRRIRTRIDNDDMPEMKMAEEEVGINSDRKRLRAAQKSINRDLTSAKIKLRVVMEQYKEDIL